jgi:hypothetical protein
MAMVNGNGKMVMVNGHDDNGDGKMVMVNGNAK